MIYFPPPLLEYEPDINIGPYETATTGSTPANQLTCKVPPGNIGERLLLFAYAKYSASSLLAPAGWNSGVGYGYNVTYGGMHIWSKVSNGTETTATPYMENSAIADITLLCMRIKGDINVLPASGSYYSADDQALAGTAITNIIQQNPFIKNSLFFAVMGAQSTIPLTSSDLPSPNNYLTTVNSANTSFLIGYRKVIPTDSLVTAWTNTVGTRRAFIAHYPTNAKGIGDPYGYNSSSYSHTTATKHHLLVHPYFARKTKGYEEVYAYQFRTASFGANTPSGVVELGIYDITEGYNTAKLMTSMEISDINSNKLNIAVLPEPYRLTEGRTYALGYRCGVTMSSGAFPICYAYAGGGSIRLGVLDGTSQLSSTWIDSGTTGDGRISVGALVRYNPAAATRKLKQIPSKINQKTRKPSYPSINYQNPITRGLTFIYIPESGDVNLVNKSSRTGGANRRRGVAGQLALNDSRAEFGYPTGNPLKNQMSMLAIAIVSGFQNICTVSDTTLTFNEPVNLCRNDGSSNNVWQVSWLRDARDVSTSYSAQNFWDPTQPVVGAFARKKSGTQQFQRFYKNGKFHSDGSLAIAHSNSGANIIRVGEQSAGGNRAKAIYLIAIWNRDLTDAELTSVTEDPYQLFSDVTNISYSLNGYEDEPSTLLKVNGDNTIYPGETGIVAVGRELLPADSAQLRYGTKTIEVQNFSPATFPTFTAPPLETHLTSGIPFGTVTVDILEKS